MSSDPLVGTRVGSVRLVRRLGAGAMGVVYQGWHEGFAREVAVKFLLATTGNSRERFLREGRAAAKIDHPHVIRILDAGQVDGRAYLVLEYVNGRSLGDLLDGQAEVDRAAAPRDGRPTGSLPDLGVVAMLGAQMAEGLAAIHRAGIVHRDIKPDNVMVSAEGLAKIADLGLAKQVSDPELLRLTATGMVVGTPLYVSPEGIRDPAAISGAADIYSLGATLYHLVSGQPPFPGATAYEVMRGHLEAPVRPLREVRPGIAAPLADAIERCLAKKPADRPTAEQVSASLAGGTSPIRRRRRHTALIGGIAVTMAVVLAIAGTAGWWLVGRNDPATITPATSAGGRLSISTDRPCQIRIDNGPLQDVAQGVATFIADAPGPRRISVVSTGDGPSWNWSGTIEAVADDQPAPKAQPIIFARTAVAPVRVAMAGDGMAYRLGRAYGLDPQVTLSHAGTYALGRWNGAVWTPLSAEIDRTGSLTITAGTITQQPDGPAWWIDRDDAGVPVPRHRIVSWYEAEQVRAKLGLVEPPGWRAFAARPEQPAQQLGAALVVSLVNGVAGGGRLPTPEAARDIAAAVPDIARKGLWSQIPDVVAGRPATAMLVLVP